MWEDESVKLLLIAELGKTCFPDTWKYILQQNSWCLQDANEPAERGGRPIPGGRLADPKATFQGQPNRITGDHSRDTLVGKWQTAGTPWRRSQTSVCLGPGFGKDAHMLCKANVQRQPSVLMFFGIKLHDCALLSKMCKCVNYAKTDCQCKLKKWKIWCTLTVRVQGCGLPPDVKDSLQLSILGGSGRIRRE